MNLTSFEIDKTVRSRRRLHFWILLVILMFSLSFLPVLAGAAGRPGPDKEALLQEARGVMDRDQVSAKGLREVISLLEGYAPQFPGEARFPLYLAEAYYRLADPQADVSREFHYYERTATYARKVLEMAPNRIEGHYWSGLALLKKAQKNGGVGAYFVVKEGIRELEKVRQALPIYDHAGASRVLGLLYCLAPKWSPFGDLDKSIKLAEEATRLAPDYPLNRLYLADAYKKRGDKEAAIRGYKKLLADSARLPAPQAEGFSQQARASLRSLGHPI